jgi:phage tail sheath protein FI
MATYKTPGVYTEEISLLPPSVAEVATAIPAFIGYTEFAKFESESLLNKPTRITSLLDYNSMFGGPPVSNFMVQLTTDEDGNRDVSSIQVTDTPSPPFLLYYSLSLYFKNGGGPCYIVSVGDYSQTLDKKAFQAGLDELRKEDEPTLILLTDAVNLSPSDYYELCQASLQQCSDLHDRFAIFDVLAEDNDGRGKIGGGFRNNIVGDLKYGAAYYPYLQTSINYAYTDESVAIQGFIDKNGEIFFGNLRISYAGQPAIPPKAQVALGDVTEPTFAVDEATNTLTITLKSDGDTVDNIVGAWASKGVPGNFSLHRTTFISAGTDGLKPVPLELSDLRVTYRGKATPAAQAEVKLSGKAIEFAVDDTNNTLTITVPEDGRTIEDIVAAWQSWGGKKGNFNIVQFDSHPTITAAVEASPLVYYQGDEDAFYLGHTAIRLESTALYNKIKAGLTKQRVVLPSSPAIAGVYARVDRTRGVWNAPANEGIMATIKPMVKITGADQENLNVDTTAGKSINAIRGFAGQGVLIWGSRTLAGNDNEWRYIPVRRLFIMIEQSIKKSTAWAVFGPNDAMAWLKVKAMIESYLEGLWRQGALVGSKAEQAFFVRVGLGTTMTEQDILEGRMIIEVGIAAVRPAEFIILRFSHKMQEA